MPTAKDRYDAATAYVRRSISAVETAPLQGNDAGVGALDVYAAKLQTEPARNDLRHIEDHWATAKTTKDQERVAREAELLADRVEENLPGAPQDRARTNLFKGEKPTSTPALSMQSEMEHQAGDAWHWAKQQSGRIEKRVRSWLWWSVLIGAGYTAYKLTSSRTRHDQ